MKILVKETQVRLISCFLSDEKFKHYNFYNFVSIKVLF